MGPTIYGYIRVSTKEQCEERQLIALREFPVPDENIFMDKLSGKDFNRPQYKKLLRKLMRYQEEGYRINDFVLQYVTHAEFPAVAIGGFRTEEQLLEGLDGVESRLPEEALRELAELKEKQQALQEAAT